MNNIKLLLILLLSSPLIQTLCFSQTTQKNTDVVITRSELKTANLIFAEHDMFSKEIPILNKEILSYKELIQNYNSEDSIKSKLISNYQNQIIDLNKTIKKDNKKLKVQKTLGISGGILLFLLGVFITK